MELFSLPIELSYLSLIVVTLYFALLGYGVLPDPGFLGLRGLPDENHRGVIAFFSLWLLLAYCGGPGRGWQRLRGPRPSDEFYTRRQLVSYGTLRGSLQSGSGLDIHRTWEP